jgi:tetratricopeptide (TPR) repeat protein
MKKQLEEQRKAKEAQAQKPPIDDPQPEDVKPPQKQEAPGIMEITVVSQNGKPTANGGNASGMHANGVEALLRTARNQYQVGDYSSAANSYERALRAGADPASSNQRLAQCYEKLGRNADAVAAYSRAADAFQAELDAGKGDKSRLSSAIDSCKQAIKVLGG